MPIVHAKLLFALTCLFLSFSGKPTLAQNCSFTISDIQFGNVDVTANTVIDTTTRLTGNCSGIAGQTLRICLDVGSGTSGADPGYTRRHMYGPASPLDFNLFANAGRTVLLGTAGTAGAGPMTILKAINSNGKMSVSQNIWARLYPGQQTSPVGAYNTTFSSGDLRIRYVYDANQTCDTLSAAAETTTSFMVAAQVIPRCTVSATTLDFGTVGLIKSDRTATNALSVVCTTGAPYSIGLNGGMANAANPAQRQMTSGTNTLFYGLYRDPSRLIPWGENTGVNTQGATGIGTTQRFTVFGKVPVQQTPPPGTYNDTVIVTVTY